MTNVFGPPTISRAKFADVLHVAKSPVLDERPADQYFDKIVQFGLDPAFMLAIFKNESQYATDPKAVVVRWKTKNWGNTRSKRADVPGVVIDTDGGKFVEFIYWLDGLEDACYRLVDPTFNYAKAGAKDVASIIHIYAPADDGNDPNGYANRVIQLMNLWKDSTVTYRIALSAGHRNTDGGNSYEQGTTALLVPHIAQACRRLGFDVRVVQPNDGAGMFPGGLQQVARTVVDWSNAGWVPDIYLEAHTEGVADPGVRGVFAIYPDATGDTDVDVRDKLGPDLVKRVSAACNIPVRANGLMSEKATGVGIGGDRLGIFLVTKSLRKTTTRLIVEFGSHSNPVEHDLQRTNAFLEGAGSAVAASFATFLGATVPTPAPNPNYYPATGFYVDPLVFDFFHKAGDWQAYGYPLEGSHTDPDGVVRQLFENVLLEHWPDGRVRLGGLGQRFAALQKSLH